jgi:hypothetical protein
MCEQGKQVVLDLPVWVDQGKQNRTIAIDECCVNVIRYLWNAGVETLSHCCGHGKLNPSLVIPDGYNEEAIKTIINLIRKIDNRYWDIYQWKLTKVNV